MLLHCYILSTGMVFGDHDAVFCRQAWCFVSMPRPRGPKAFDFSMLTKHPAGEQDKRIARPLSRQLVNPAAHAFRHAARAVQTPLPISLRRSPITSTLLVEYSNLGVRTPGFPKIAPLSNGIAVFFGKYTFTRGPGGSAAVAEDPGEKAGDTWARVRRHWGTLVSAAPLIRAKLDFVDRHGVW